MALRVWPTPTRFPAYIPYIPVGQQTFAFYIKFVALEGVSTAVAPLTHYASRRAVLYGSSVFASF